MGRDRDTLGKTLVFVKKLILVVLIKLHTTGNAFLMEKRNLANNWLALHARSGAWEIVIILSEDWNRTNPVHFCAQFPSCNKNENFVPIFKLSAHELFVQV